MGTIKIDGLIINLDFDRIFHPSPQTTHPTCFSCRRVTRKDDIMDYNDGRRACRQCHAAAVFKVEDAQFFMRLVQQCFADLGMTCFTPSARPTAGGSAADAGAGWGTAGSAPRAELQVCQSPSGKRGNGSPGIAVTCRMQCSANIAAVTTVAGAGGREGTRRSPRTQRRAPGRRPVAPIGVRAGSCTPASRSPGRRWAV